MDEINGASGVGVMVHGVDQMLADKRATTSYRREKSLMNKQNAMNLSNAMTMPSIEAHGLRMAGFNPAMINGAGASPAPTATKGSADMAPTNSMDLGGIAQLALINAQRDNIEAQTDKIKAETNVTKWDESPNKQADTANKLASALRNGADAGRIQRENEAFDEENEHLAGFGQAMAEKWQGSDWYKGLSLDTKSTIDLIASGEVPLSVGAVRALSKVIASQKDLSNADRALVDNAFANAITEAMWNDDKVRSALALMPVTMQDKSKAETAKNIVETGILRIDKANKQDERDVYLHQDPDKLYLEYQKNPSLENLVKWLGATINDKLNKAYDAGTHAVGPAAGGYLAGKGMSKASESQSNTQTRTYDAQHTPTIFNSDGYPIAGGYTDQGVQQMRSNKTWKH